MTNPFLFISFMLLISALFTIFISADDSAAMHKLASALQPKPESWCNLKGTHYCLWEHVKCDGSNRVTEIYLCNRKIKGTLPSELSTLSQLRNLSFERNQLEGPLPSFANLINLQEVKLGSNKFTKIPKGFFRGLISLQKFNIRENRNLDPWELPKDLAQSTKLVSFDASGANVRGSIPDIFSSLHSLQDLNLSDNNLTGTLPGSFANSSIRKVCLSNQEMGLTGTINVLSLMTQLRQVWLESNDFTGPIPDLSKCKKLFNLQLSHNEFTGIVPVSLTSHSALRNVSLSWNNLQGPVPHFPPNVKVDMGNNNFCQDICDPQVTIMLNIASAMRCPDRLKYWNGSHPCDWEFISCDGQKRISTVIFENLNFSGTISSEFSNLTALKKLILTDNFLMGSIPDSLTQLSELQILDVSNNNLSGNVPKFAPSVKVITEGNPLIRANNVSEGPEQQAPAPYPSSNKVLPLKIAGITIAISLIVMLFVLFKYKKLFLSSPRCQSRRIKCWPEMDGVISELQGSGSNHSDQGRIVFSVKHLRRMTNNFSENNILGRGGCGVVYKGEMDDGTCIAVKRIKVGLKEKNGFGAEIKVLTRVRHRHLVSLLGYCINGDEKLLVYEYMPRGTLMQHLFQWREHRLLALTWKERISIALDVARGVEYLHSLAKESFIHRDLKPSNILLGIDLRAKVADFGLVKTTVHEIQSLETKVAGTFGYLAPEYAVTGKVTRKVDVYAFGVILMEMITGRKAVDNMAKKEGWMSMHLVTWFRELLVNKEDIRSVIDKTLNTDEQTLVSISKVSELAEHCTAPEPQQRPDMGYIVSTLVLLFQEWKPPIREDKKNICTDEVNSTTLSEAETRLVVF